MVSIKGIRSSIGFNLDRALLAYILFAGTFMGIIGLSVYGIPIGELYFNLAVGSLILFMFMLLFIKYKSKEYGLRLPVQDSNAKAAFMFLFGLILAPLIVLLSAGRLIPWKIMSPLQLFNVGAPQSVASYQTLIAQANPFFKVYSIAITAGVVEELVFGFGAFSVGLIFGIWFLKYVFKRDLRSKGGQIWLNIFASGVSVFAFVLAHRLNPQYTGIMFLSAAVFRAAMNIAMFYGFGLEFTMGYHIGNNATFLGMTAILAALLDPVGALVGLFILAVIILAVRHLTNKYIKKKKG